jgi:hypothetical protein
MNSITKLPVFAVAFFAVVFLLGIFSPRRQHLQSVEMPEAVAVERRSRAADVAVRLLHITRLRTLLPIHLLQEVVSTTVTLPRRSLQSVISSKLHQHRLSTEVKT